MHNRVRARSQGGSANEGSTCSSTGPTSSDSPANDNDASASTARQTSTAPASASSSPKTLRHNVVLPIPASPTNTSARGPGPTSATNALIDINSAPRPTITVPAIAPTDTTYTEPAPWAGPHRCDRLRAHDRASGGCPHHPDSQQERCRGTVMPGYRRKVFETEAARSGRFECPYTGYRHFRYPSAWQFQGGYQFDRPIPQVTPEGIGPLRWGGNVGGGVIAGGWSGGGQACRGSLCCLASGVAGVDRCGRLPGAGFSPPADRRVGRCTVWCRPGGQ